MAIRCAKCGQNKGAIHVCPMPSPEKECSRCHHAKLIGEFGLQKSWNGKLYPKAICKLCATIKSREWATKNPEKRKAIWRAHAESNRDKYAESNRAYYRRHGERRMAALQAYWKANPGKREARHAIAYALQTGRIQRKPCEHCGSQKRVHAHHHDYSKPLEVTWLCSICHGKEHRAA